MVKVTLLLAAGFLVGFHQGVLVDPHHTILLGYTNWHLSLLRMVYT